MSRNLQKAWILGQSRMGKPTKSGEENRGETIYLKKRRKDYFLLISKKREQCWLLGPGAPYLGHRRHSEHLNSRRGRKLSIFHHSPCFWENISIFTLCWRFHFFLQLYHHDCMFIMQIETDSCIYMYFQVLGKNSSTWYMFMICVNALLPFQCF